MANFTPNYNLKKPVGNDNFNVDDQNGNMDVIDTAMKGLDTKINNITVPVTSVNTKTGAVVLGASDVGAVPSTRTVNGSALSSDINLTASDVGAVPTSRKVNNKTLTTDITLSASDVGAEPTITKNTAFNQNFETSASNIKMNGTAAVGTSSNVARADHVHDSDTAKANQTSLDTTNKNININNYPITNLITNGDFSNGTTGWIANSGTAITASNNILTCTVTATGMSIGVYEFIGTVDVSHKYYFSYIITPKYANIVNFGFDSAPVSKTPVAGIPNMLSTITSPIATSTKPIVFYHDCRTNYAINDTFTIQKCFLIDLTQIFGVGNEPTQAQMDAWLATQPKGYFEGKLATNNELYKDIQINNYPITNLIPNGDFNDGTSTGWGVSGFTKSVSSNKLVLVESTNTETHVSDYYLTTLAVAGHKYYAKAYAYDGGAINLFNYNASGSYESAYGNVVSGAGVSSCLLSVTTLNSTPNFFVRLFKQSGSYLGTGATYKFSYITIIDLTAIFGAGNEPSQSQMDSWIATYPNMFINGTVGQGLSASDYGKTTYAVTSGTSTAYTVTLSPSPTAYVDGMQIVINPHVASGATPTLNVNGLGALTILKQDGSAIASGDIAINKPLALVRVGSNFFIRSSGGKSYKFPKWFNGSNFTISATNMQYQRNDLTSSAVGTNIYCIGGIYDVYADYTVMNDMYDSTSNTWTYKANMTTSRYGLTSSAVGTNIYCIGGYGSSAYLSINEMYDTLANTWTTKMSMLNYRVYCSSSAVGTNIYCIGGQSNFGSFLAHNEMYNTLANTWTTKTSIPTSRTTFGSSAVGTNIYCTGGWASGGAITYSTEMYDTIANTWTTKASMLNYRRNHTSSAVGTNIYCIGGDSGNYALSTNEMYDTLTNTWTTRTSIITKRTRFTSSVVDSSIYCIGGTDVINSTTFIYSTNEVYIV